MPLRLRELYLPLDHGPEDLLKETADVLGIEAGDIIDCVILRRSLDARQKGRPKFVYAVECHLAEPEDEARLAEVIPPVHAYAKTADPPRPAKPGAEALKGPVVVVGSGPAGLMAALSLAEAGYRPTLVERGAAVEERDAAVARFARGGELDPSSNVVFGEGGAGTYSDGKLTHRASSPEADRFFGVLLQCGAPQEIAYEAKAHVGSDLLPRIVARLRKTIENAGGRVIFGARAGGFEIAGGNLQRMKLGEEEVSPGAVVFAPGLSARDTWREMLGAGFSLECRPTLIGIRVEHPQELIDRAQYGSIAGHPALPPAGYFLKRNASGRLRAVHSFCMCPGGWVIPVASDPERLSTNGMSRFARDSGYANAALIAPVGPADYGREGPLAGVEFLEDLESRVYAAGGGDYALPSQELSGFVRKRRGGKLPPGPADCRRVPADVGALLPPVVADSLRAAVKAFARNMDSFMSDDAGVYGLELRTGSPVRITRSVTGESLSAGNVYPAGEGAGYAGGIVSSASDGLRQAARVMARFAAPA